MTPLARFPLTRFSLTRLPLARLPLARLPLSRVPLAATGWVTLLLVTALPDAAPLRIAVVSVYLLFLPGAALLHPLRPALSGLRPNEPGGPGTPGTPGGPGLGTAADEDGRGAVAAQNLLLVVMLSLSALVAAATALMLAGAFSGDRTRVVLAALTSAGALCPALRPAAGA